MHHTNTSPMETTIYIRSVQFLYNMYLFCNTQTHECMINSCYVSNTVIGVKTFTVFPKHRKDNRLLH